MAFRFSYWRSLLPILILVASAPSWPTRAQAPLLRPEPLDVPAPRPGEIKLKAATPAAAKTGEKWEKLFSGVIVRNVAQATLTPVLPPAGKANGTAVVIAPGGGFMMLSIKSEGHDVAEYLASKGITAFVLKYRLQPTPADGAAAMTELMSRLSRTEGVADLVKAGTALATEDAQEAMRTVRANASRWGVDPNKVGFMGFSAGAFTTMGLVYKNDLATRPDFIAPIYGPTWTPTEVVPSSPPPMWASIAGDDQLLLGSSDFGLINAWRAKGGTVEFHLYDKGGHGYGFAGTPKTTTVHWPQDFLDWLESRGLYLPTPKL